MKRVRLFFERWGLSPAWPIFVAILFFLLWYTSVPGRPDW